MWGVDWAGGATGGWLGGGRSASAKEGLVVGR